MFLRKYRIGALRPVDKVWEVLDDFGDIARWNPGVKKSALTSTGPVSQGSTPHGDFAPDAPRPHMLNGLGRLAKGTTDKQLRNGLGGLVESLQQESERLAVV